MANDQDNQFIVDYLRGDENSLKLLFQSYLKPIYGFVCRYVGSGPEAEDITEEIFVKVWRNLKKFNLNRSFKTWIFAIAKNSSLDFLKKKKMIPFSEFDDEEGKNLLVETVANPAELPQEILEKADLARTLNSAMEKLSPECRTILVLRYNDHFNFREIAESFGESINTIKSRHCRALLLLRKILAAEENDLHQN